MRHEFSNTNRVTIEPGAPGVVTSSIDVEGVHDRIRDVNVGFDIDHTWTDDLRVSLIAPDGTAVLLVSGEGGSGDNFRDTRFDDAALASVAGARAPFRGTFRPEESLTAFNGSLPGGVWTLRIEDRAFQDGGRLNAWSLSIESCCYHFANDTPVRIDPGPVNTVTSAIAVTNVGGMVIDTLSVSVDIRHTWVRDLELTLIGPDGTRVLLVEREGGSGDNFEGTTFDDSATRGIRGAQPPFRGRFRPEGQLADFHQRLINGVWTLRVDDHAPQDGGTLNGWSLDIIAEDAAPRRETDFNIEVRFAGGLTVNQRSVFDLAAARWAEIVTGDLPGVQFEGEEIDDLRIVASGELIDGPGGTLGAAGPTHFRPGSGLPYRGIMRFDRADLADMEADGSLIDVIIHEMGHVIGLGTLWHGNGLVAGTGTDDPRFTGRNAVREYTTLRGGGPERPVPIANTGGPGTREGHWREATFDHELMTGFIDPGDNPLSRMTIASLADMGYQVNLEAADRYTLPGALVHSLKREVCRVRLVNAPEDGER